MHCQCMRMCVYIFVCILFLKILLRRTHTHTNTQVDDQLQCVGFGANSRYLLTGGTGRIVKIWDLKKQTLARTLVVRRALAKA